MGKKSSKRCSVCQKEATKEDLFEIDSQPACVNCLYGNVEPFKMYPIGAVRNDLSRSKEGFGTAGSSGISLIELFPSQERFLYKLEDEEYLTIVYYFHKARSVKSIFERGLDRKETGVFATRTPDRLSRIGIQDVTLVKREGTTLHVEGLDAINGTPVLDIKLAWSKIKH